MNTPQEIGLNVHIFSIIFVCWTKVAVDISQGRVEEGQSRQYTDIFESTMQQNDRTYWENG